MTVDESLIPEHNRISRVTSATWKYENGAVGSFVHLTALQGHDYSCELEVFADGYQMKCVSLPSARGISIANQCFSRLVNPYVQPVLYVRRPGSDAQETHTFSDDDPFFSEVRVLSLTRLDHYLRAPF